MRHVDMELLPVPHDWEARAEQALNELRNEIMRAEADALVAGADAEGVADARKKAISEGLALKRRTDLWRELAAELGKLRKGKCWYSESRNPASDKDIDHFRPKNRIEDEDGHEGYWWLAFKWQNYRYASAWCNQWRNDKVNGTAGGKRDSFPLSPGSFRAMKETDSCDEEEVDLLDPADPEDWKLLTFRPDGHPVPAKPKGTAEYRRAEISIKAYHLHCKELVDDRRPLAGQIRRLIEELELLRPRITTDLPIRKLYMKRQADLLRAVHPDSEYSAAALAYARAEVYKSDRGEHIKRDWLEEMLGLAVLL
jgi:hypothetical protein